MPSGPKGERRPAPTTEQPRAAQQGRPLSANVPTSVTPRPSQIADARPRPLPSRFRDVTHPPTRPHSPPSHPRISRFRDARRTCGTLPASHRSPCMPSLAINPATKKPPTECPHCGCKGLTRKGVREKKLERVQLWQCAYCHRVITPAPPTARNMTYPLEGIEPPGHPIFGRAAGRPRNCAPAGFGGGLPADRHTFAR
jgi:hypothetical protein